MLAVKINNWKSSQPNVTFNYFCKIDKQYWSRLPGHLRVQVHQHLFFFEGSVHRMTQMTRAACFSLVSIVANEHTWLWAFRWISVDHCQLPVRSTGADRSFLHVQCEHINCELWLYIAANLLVQCELELNHNIYKIVQCVTSLTYFLFYICNCNKPTTLNYNCKILMNTTWKETCKVNEFTVENHSSQSIPVKKSQ